MFARELEKENLEIMKRLEKRFEGSKFFKLDEVVFNDDDTLVVHYSYLRKEKQKQKVYKRSEFIRPKCKICGEDKRVVEGPFAIICHGCQTIVVKKSKDSQ